MDHIEQKRKDLEEKILAKRQQVEFEKESIQESKISDEDNTMNPEVSEEFKNFYDPEGNVIESSEYKELSRSEQELIYLIDKLNKLNKENS
ncbi:MAG TPA: hypothetical protein VGN64_15525 [Dyadobacter sp.]|jgi:hypothetical protein|nr:hypothetical protein [Dyadobacter sp.]